MTSCGMVDSKGTIIFETFLIIGIPLYFHVRAYDYMYSELDHLMSDDSDDDDD